MALTWTDQPAALEAAEIVFTYYHDCTFMEVRKAAHDDWYVTTGTLWGSQTVRCDSAEKVLRLMALAKQKKNNRPINLPAEYTLMEL